MKPRSVTDLGSVLGDRGPAGGVVMAPTMMPWAGRGGLSPPQGLLAIAAAIAGGDHAAAPPAACRRGRATRQFAVQIRQRCKSDCRLMQYYTAPDAKP